MLVNSFDIKNVYIVSHTISEIIFDTLGITKHMNINIKKNWS